MRVATVLIGLVALASAQEGALESPSDVRQRIQGQRPIFRPSPEQSKEATAYLALWDKAVRSAGRKPEGRERIDIGQLRVWSGDVESGLEAIRAVAADAALDADLRAAARKEYAQWLSVCRSRLSLEAITAARAVLATMAKEGENDESGARVILWQAAVYLAHFEGDAAATLAACWKAIDEEPKVGAIIARYAIAARMSGVYRMEEYDGLRQRIAKMIEEIKQGALQSPTGRRSAMMERLVERMLTRPMKPVEMLGKPTAPWTVEHVFKGPASLAEHKGKVVLLYFWQTRQDEAVRGFAALRDLAKRYADKEFAIVTVTWPGFAVYPARFELDPDIDKPVGPGMEGHRIGAREPDAEKVEQFRKQEPKTIAEFLRNHEIPWSAVMIPLAEVAQQCGGVGYPTTLLVDAEGRVRYIKPAPLRRGSKIASEEIPTIIDALLKEAG